LHRRIDQLGLRAWQSEVIVHDRPPVLVPDIPVERTKEPKCCKFVRMERVSLSELAVWKAVCVAGKDKGCYLSWQEWLREGWRGGEAEVRPTREINIVIVSVSETALPKPKT
jgi:hypothetical protein